MSNAFNDLYAAVVNSRKYRPGGQTESLNRYAGFEIRVIAIDRISMLVFGKLMNDLLTR